VLGILATVVSVMFCCIPHGLISLIFALQVNSKATAGDMVGAASAAKQAKTWGIVSLALSVVWLVIAIVLGVLNVLLSAIAR
jgi:hypothetical protein